MFKKSLVLGTVLFQFFNGFAFAGEDRTFECHINQFNSALTSQIESLGIRAGIGKTICVRETFENDGNADTELAGNSESTPDEMAIKGLISGSDTLYASRAGIGWIIRNQFLINFDETAKTATLSYNPENQSVGGLPANQFSPIASSTCAKVSVCGASN